MTSNQYHAVEVARCLLAGELNASGMTEGEWHLLLLGAGVNCQEAPLLKVAGRVLENALSHTGYFAPAKGSSYSSPQGQGDQAPSVFHC
jgi:hypothetical protein